MSIVRLQGEAEKQKHIYFEVDAASPAMEKVVWVR